MSSPRIPMLPLDEAIARGAELHIGEEAARLSIFRIWFQHPELARSFSRLLNQMLWKGRLDQRLRELMIMRLGWSTGSVYEWTQHWRIAVDFLQIDGDDVLAVRDWRTSDRLDDADRAVLAAVDDVVEQGYVSDDTWKQLTTHVSEDIQVLLEIVHVAAGWRMVSTILRSIDVPLEDGVDPWPPDGTNPA